MSRLTQWMDRTFYLGYDNNWDNELFRAELRREIKPDTICLDYGAGRGRVKQLNFKGVAGSVAGVDPDEAILQNPHLDEARLLVPPDFIVPYPDNTFDVVFSANVLEHVRNPGMMFQEIRRILKPGGVFWGKTVNQWHYMVIIARSTPNFFHRFYNQLRGRNLDDTFPTVYRCNTEKTLRRYGRRAGFKVERMDLIEGRPEYLRISAITYLFGLAYERLVNVSEVLRFLRCVMVFKLRKPSENKKINL